MARLLFCVCLLFAAPRAWGAPVEYVYTDDGSTVTITGYGGAGGAVTIPSVLGPSSHPVTSIGGYAFLGCTSLTSVTIPSSVTSLGT